MIRVSSLKESGCMLLPLKGHIGHSLNSLKGLYIGQYIGDYYGAY